MVGQFVLFAPCFNGGPLVATKHKQKGVRVLTVVIRLIVTQRILLICGGGSVESLGHSSIPHTPFSESSFGCK